MVKADVYSIKGTKIGIITLPKEFDEKANNQLLAQAMRVYEDNTHFGLAKVQTRAEVNRTTKKWYRQKGTGGARHGSRRAPIFVGGGVAHGPKGVKRELTLPLKMRRKALKIVFSEKARNKEVFVVDSLSKMEKTKEAVNLTGKLRKIAGEKAKRFTFVLKEDRKSAEKATRNLKSVDLTYFKDLNAYKVFYAGMLVFDRNVFESKSESKSKTGKTSK